MKIRVLDKKWKIIVRSDAAHDRRFPETHAVAILEDRKIHVRFSSLNNVTLIHELIHAYQFELSFHELELDDDQTEEWYAELFAKYGPQIIDDVEKLLSQYDH